MKSRVYGISFCVLIFLVCANGSDNICNTQKEIIGNAFKKQDPISVYKFLNDSKTSLEVTWLGENSGKIILVTTSELLFGQVGEPSDIYLSNDNGKNFEKITEKIPISKPIVHKDNGLQRSTVDTNMVYIVCYKTNEKSSLIMTHDGSTTWKNANLDFILDKQIIFHPTNKLWLLTLSRDNKLFKSEDGGLTWTNILDNVYQFQWSASNAIFAKVGRPREKKDILQMFFERLFTRQTSFTLNKYDGKKWKTINKNVFGFLIRDKFLYVSEIVNSNSRRLIVSIDEGKTFNRVYLPTIVNQQFYSILDIENDLVFIHVDNNDNNGDGTLFTSDSDGRVFSQSLLNHFYPSQSFTCDFYKILSMRATYVASQLKPDKSIQTLITYNRGAEWKRIKKSEIDVCHEKEKTECYLQIANGYSAMKRVKSYLPLSSPTALGLVLVHGHLSDSLKTTKTDVYSSSDGGYNWMKSLSGPHQYVIADHGGLLVALGEDNQVIKFSTDEGRCWHEYQYTTEDVKVTGLLTEPGNKAMTVAIWGYLNPSNHWMIHVVDLSQVLSRECADSDYEQWFAHSEMLHPSGKEYVGCLLGKKETFLRLKKDSLCKNGYSHTITKTENLCPCTEDDFECEYGYYRTVNSRICVRNELITENLCVKGVEERILTQGYKKIPSDVCQGGFKPDLSKQQMLNLKCNENDDKWKIQNVSIEVPRKSVEAVPSKIVNNNDKRVVYIVVGLAACFIGLILIVVIINRTRNIRRRQSNLKYRVLAGLDRRHDNTVDDDDAALLINEGGYESTGQTAVHKGKLRNAGGDSDVDLIG